MGKKKREKNEGKPLKTLMKTRLNKQLREAAGSIELKRSKRFRLIPDGILEEYVYYTPDGDILVIEFIAFKEADFIETPMDKEQINEYYRH